MINSWFDHTISECCLFCNQESRKKDFCGALYDYESVVAGGYIIYYGFCWEMVGINYMLIPMTLWDLWRTLPQRKRTDMCSRAGSCREYFIHYWRILQPIQES